MMPSRSCWFSSLTCSSTILRRAAIRSSEPLGSMSGNVLGVHRVEELGVALGLAQLVEQELDGVDDAHRVEDAAEDIHLLERVLVDEQLLLAGAGAGDVDRGEDALVGHLAVENDFRVAGALELLEDDLVHARA